MKLIFACDKIKKQDCQAFILLYFINTGQSTQLISVKDGHYNIKYEK